MSNSSASKHNSHLDSPQHSTTRKRSPTTRTQHLKSLSVHSPTTSPSQQPLFDFQPVHSSSDVSQLCQDDQWSSKEPVDMAGNTSSSGHDTPGISPPVLPRNVHQHSASLHSSSMPFHSNRRCSSLPPSFHQLKNTRNERSRSPSP